MRQPCPPSDPSISEVTDTQAADGKKFGNYTLVDELARGGMGVVYRARDDRLNRTVALKMILSGRFAAEEDIRRFYQEAEAAANLDHSGIVPIYDIGEHEGHHYFAMKLIEGGSLAERLPELRKNPRECVELIAKMARAVHYAHQRGILHRDIKPANILIDTDGSPLLSDLGLAKDTKTDSGLTHTGAVVGTPGYMPPEQAEGKKEITTAADIYAVGAILYEVLTGKPPHAGDTVVETLRRVIDENPDAPRSINRKVNRTLELICMKCLEKNPNDRYSSAGALADDLENWLEDKPVSVRPPSVGSIFGNTLRQAFRSVLGAALIGLGAGAIASTITWLCFLAGELSDGRDVYKELPSEPFSPLIYLPSLPDSFFVPLAIAVLVMLVMIGLVITAIVRPKPGAQAVAVGLVAGLMMTISTYCLSSGFLAIAMKTHNPMSGEARLMAQATVGTEVQKARGERLILRKYPDLAKVDAEERAGILVGKFMIDSLTRTPTAIVIGFLGTALGCVVPCLGGTAFASRLYHEKPSVLRIFIPYFELMAVMAFGFVFFALLHSLRVLGARVSLPSIGHQIGLAVTMALFAFAGIRRWKWPVRLGLHALWITAFVLFLLDLNAIGSSYKQSWQKVAAGDWDGAADDIERFLKATPNSVYARFLCGVVQSRAGDRERYREHCLFSLEKARRTIDPLDAEQTAKLCLLCPDSLDDFTPAIEMSKFATQEATLENHQYLHWMKLTRTLAAYRENDLAGVHEWAEKCREYDHKHVRATCDVVEAMAFAKEGDVTSARSLIDAAKKRMGKIELSAESGRENDVIYETLMIEASKLIDATEN